MTCGRWKCRAPSTTSPRSRAQSAPDPPAVEAAADKLVKAKMPLIYAGQGVHYAKAWDELKAVAELLEAPVTTSLEGKSAFDETHALSLGAGGVAMSRALAAYVEESDVVFGAGASFSATSFGIKFPVKDKRFIHNTTEPMDIDKNIPADVALVGDSKLALGMLHEALKDRLKKPRGLTPKVAAKHQEVQRALVEGVDAAPHQQRETHAALPGDLGFPAPHRREEHHRHARCRQPAR